MRKKMARGGGESEEGHVKRIIFPSLDATSFGYCISIAVPAFWVMVNCEFVA